MEMWKSHAEADTQYYKMSSQEVMGSIPSSGNIVHPVNLSYVEFGPNCYIRVAKWIIFSLLADVPELNKH